MPILKRKICDILDKNDISINKLAHLIGENNSSNLNQMILGKKKFPITTIKKLLPILEVSKEEFESWILANKYPKNVIKRAIQIKKEFPYKRKSVLTAKIDEILQDKNLSRTALAKEIKYSQSGLNAIIIRKRSMSKSVLEKIAKALEIPENEITSWILADKYSLQTLETAYSCVNN